MLRDRGEIAHHDGFVCILLINVFLLTLFGDQGAVGISTGGQDGEDL